MRHLIKPPGVVRRFELPGSSSFNFLLTRALGKPEMFPFLMNISGGGGLSSLQVDRQGKSYGQMLLSLELDVPAEWRSLLKQPQLRSTL